MATITQRLAFIIQANADGAIKAFDKTAQQAEKQLGKTQKTIDKLGVSMTRFGATGLAIAGTVGAGLVRMGQQASDLQETISKTRVIFGDVAGDIEKFAETTADSLGLSKRAALDAASTFATFGKSAGLAGGELSTFSKELVTLSADLASFYNTSPEDAVLAIGAALRGESEPIRRYGVLLNDASLKQKALELGIYDGIGALSAQQKVLAAQAEILSQTGDAQGDFARTSDGLANQQRRLSASMEDLQASLGEGMLPIMQRVTDIALNAANGFVALDRSTGGVIGQVAAFGTLGFGAVSALSLIGGQAIKLRSQFFLLDKETNKMTRSLTSLGKFTFASTAIVGAASIAYGLLASAKAKAEQQTRNLTDALKAEAEGNKESLQEIIKSDKNLQRYIEQLNRLGLGLGDIREYIESNTGSFKRFADVLTGQIEPGTAEYERTLLEINKALLGSDQITSELGNELKFLGGETEKIVRILLDEAKAADLATKALGDLNDATNEIEKTLVAQFKERSRVYYGRLKIERQIAEGTKKQAEESSKAADKAEKDSAATVKNTEAKRKFAAKVAEAADALRDKLNTALEDSKQKLKDATDAYNNYSQTVSGAITGVLNFGSAQSTAAGNAESLASAQQAVTDAQKEYNDAVRGRDVDKIADAYTKLTDAQKALNAESKKPQGFLAVLKEQEKSATTFATNIERLLGAGLSQAALDQIINAGADAGNAIASELLNGADPAGKIAEVNKIVSSTQAIADRVAKATADKFYQAGVDQATALVNGMQAVFDAWTPVLSDDAVGSLLNPLKSIGDYSQQVSDAVAAATTGTAVSAPVVGKKKRKIPKLAEGGIVQAEPGGRLVLLGEGGRDEAVVPLPASGLPGSGMNITVNVNAGLGADGTQIGKEIVDVLQAYQRRVGALPIKVAG